MLLLLRLHRSAVPMFVLLGTFWPASLALNLSALMFQILLTPFRTQWLQPLAGGNGHHVPVLLLLLYLHTLLMHSLVGTEELGNHAPIHVLALLLLTHVEEVENLFQRTVSMTPVPLQRGPTMKPLLTGARHLVPPLRILNLIDENRALARLLIL